MAIATKGWSERELRCVIPFQVLVLYSLCIPPYESSKDKKGGDVDEIVDMFDHLESLHSDD